MTAVSRRRLLGAPLAMLPAGVAHAAAAAEQDQKVAAGSAFAAHHLALQISDRDPHKQALVLSVANNVLTFYGVDLVAIEVVAFGPGIDLLHADSPHRVGVDSLVAQGVKFDVCMNTVETVARETGRTPVLNNKAVPIKAGVAQLMKLVEAGYMLVRP